MGCRNSTDFYVFLYQAALRNYFHKFICILFSFFKTFLFRNILGRRRRLRLLGRQRVKGPPPGDAVAAAAGSGAEGARPEFVPPDRAPERPVFSGRPAITRDHRGGHASPRPNPWPSPTPVPAPGATTTRLPSWL